MMYVFSAALLYYLFLKYEQEVDQKHNLILFILDNSIS